MAAQHTECLPTADLAAGMCTDNRRPTARLLPGGAAPSLPAAAHKYSGVASGVKWQHDLRSSSATQHRAAGTDLRAL